ncbi:MAG TPA: ABC transporter permease [Candidatus Brocadiia bacterium]|nr:ABC transporter permease [Candidatus Brocadiia bacterium]
MTEQTIKETQNARLEKPAGFWNRGLRRLASDRAALVASVFLIVVIAACLIGPSLSGYAYSEQDLTSTYQAPTKAHLMGTDNLGRDLMTRVLRGGRVSLLVGIVGTLISVAIGVVYGGIAGYLGGRADMIMMRIVDVLYGMPFMFVVILLMTVFGRSLLLLFIALGAVEWLTIARVVRGQVLEVKERDFVEGARALGTLTPDILRRHILPNVMGTIVVYATLNVPSVMLREAFLSFLGFGVQPPDASWGSLAADALTAINPARICWWLVLFPCMALSATLLALNFLGDGLRDALDPRFVNR